MTHERPGTMVVYHNDEIGGKQAELLKRILESALPRYVTAMVEAGEIGPADRYISIGAADNFLTVGATNTTESEAVRMEAYCQSISSSFVLRQTTPDFSEPGDRVVYRNAAVPALQTELVKNVMSLALRKHIPLMRMLGQAGEADRAESAYGRDGRVLIRVTNTTSAEASRMSAYCDGVFDGLTAAMSLRTAGRGERVQ